VSAADALPEFHHYERHAIAVAAAPDEALAAARETRLRKAPTGSLWDAMGAEGFRLHGEDTLVGVGKPWLVRGSMLKGENFADFDEPGYAKMAMDLRYIDGRLVTETRVFLTSRDARRAFRAYWLVIRPFSGLTRRSWLRAAKRSAEA